MGEARGAKAQHRRIKVAPRLRLGRFSPLISAWLATTGSQEAGLQLINDPVVTARSGSKLAPTFMSNGNACEIKKEKKSLLMARKHGTLN